MAANGVNYVWDDNGNVISDGVYTYIYDTADRLIGVNGTGLAVNNEYNGFGDCLSETANSQTTHYTMDVNAGLTQVLDDGINTYLYGAGRIAQYGANGAEYYLGDALGSVRQMVDANGNIALARDYQPYGEVLSSTGGGATSYGFTGEWTDGSTGDVYLRSRWYAPGQGRFLTKDTWEGDYTKPMSYNAWLYGYANPIILTDPNGFSPTIAGITINDKLNPKDKELVLETIADYAQLFGGEEILDRNLALTEITQGWNNPAGTYNAVYDYTTQKITLPFGWYSAAIVQSPNGKAQIILSSPCIEDMLDLPEGSLPTVEIGSKFVLAHEMTHAFEFGNPLAFRSFTNSVDIPWSIFAGFSSNPLIKRNAFRSISEEVFADVIAAYLYSKSLLNQQMNDWLQTKMPETLT